MTRKLNRDGFSRIDFCVVAAMLLVGLALLVPAAHALQLAAHRQATVNNLKEMGLAFHNVNDTYRRLPPACDKFATWEFPAPVHVHFLPFIEQSALYMQYKTAMGKGEAAEPNVGVYLAGEDNSNVGGKVKGVQNFAANLRVFADKGVKSAFDQNLPELAAVEPGTARMPATFRDGTSNTIVFATKFAAAGEGGSRYAAAPNSAFAAFFGQNAAKNGADPADATATFQLQPTAKEARVSPLLAQSFTKELLVSLADASVRTISQRVSAATWNSALHPSDGNVLGADW